MGLDRARDKRTFTSGLPDNTSGLSAMLSNMCSYPYDECVCTITLNTVEVSNIIYLFYSYIFTLTLITYLFHCAEIPFLLA
jgi:hypothetical protein